ncbi:protein Niban 1a [Girardinichthys multiradiatus]|uniref:protein Niban 1a n=1 Tax=Girardinichthys multiradiatus TaxID=208333 RepID=UPI001FABCC81|nr:protein Niban 1a [Girardinichthys multiradiatus]
MGVSTSSLLDETKSAYIQGQAEAELKEFSPYYRKQFSVARFAQVEDELEQNKQKITQLLKQKEAPEEGIVLYEEGVCYFDEARKWKERYVVVRANYCLECHESLQSYVKGAPPLHKLLPTGGNVQTTEEMYMEMVDKCYPDDSSGKEEFAPPLSGMPGQFPVYLRLPYRRDSYFCFKQQAKQANFLSILSDCIKHQNQDFLKKKTCEVQAFLKAVQLYRQDRGNYEEWDMLIGSDVRVMANLVMEKLLPSLGKDLLPRLKAKKTERKRVWFTTMEAAYVLVQEHLLAGLSDLKEECRMYVRQQEVLMHSDMDQILNTRRQLEEKIQATVSEPAQRLCSESVQPYLGSVLEELMEPISSGFMDGRQLIETKMEEVCQSVLQGADKMLKKALSEMARPNLLSCYTKISSLQDKLKHLQERFGFCTITAVSHGAQIDLQQLIENAAYTFELMLMKAVKDNPETTGAVVEKAKHRVLKQYDYDSSTVRKRIFQDALVSITLPFIKKNLADSCQTELQGLEHTIYPEYSNLIHVENVYENILLQILDEEVSKVVKEAASLKKHNLFKESSRSSISSVSTPNSPALVLASSIKSTSQAPPSPLAVNGLPLSPNKEVEQQEKQVLQSEAVVEVTKTLLEEVELTDDSPRANGCQKAELPEEAVQTVKVEELKTPPSAETYVLSETGETQENLSDQAAQPETENTQRTEITSSEPSAAAASPTAGATWTEAPRPDGTKEPMELPTEEIGSQLAADSMETMQSQKAGVKLEAPSGGEEAEDISQKVEEAESLTVSDPNSLDVSVGSESPRSDLEFIGGISETSDVLEVVQSSVNLEETSEDQTSAEEPSAGAQTEAEAGTTVETPAEPADATSSPPAGDSSGSPGVQPLDCVKEIRNLVVEVIEVEEPVHHYPKQE